MFFSLPCTNSFLYSLTRHKSDCLYKMAKALNPFFASAMLTLLFSQQLIAEDFNDEANSFSELPSVVSASRLNQSVLKSPSAVTVIDRAMIEATGFIEIADIMRLVPGFYVGHTGGNRFSVVSHGYGNELANRMQVLINGRSSYIPAVSAIDWDTLGIQIEDIEKIEVVRGPAPSAFSSNSFAGVINIITRDIALDDSFYSHIRMGNKGERSLSLRHSVSLDNLDYRFTANTRDNDGFDDVFDNFGFNNVVDSRNVHDLSFSAKMAVNQANTVSTRLSYANGYSGENPIDEVFEDRDTKAKAISAQLQWSHILSPTQALELNAYHNYRNENDLTKTTSPLSSLFDEEGTPLGPLLLGVSDAPDQFVEAGARTYRSNRSDIEVQYSELLNNDIQYVVGIGARYDTIDSGLFFVDDEAVSDTQLRLIGNVEIPILPKLTANLGALVEKSRVDKTRLSPRLSLNWQVHPSQSLRFSFARAYRLPSLLEKHARFDLALSNGFVINRELETTDNLKSESITSYDIGYLGSLSQFPLSWEFKLYKEQYDNIIEFVRNDNVNVANGIDFDSRILQIMNTGWFDTYGFEGEVTYRPEQHSFLRFHFNLGHGDGAFLSRINTIGSPEPREYTQVESGIPRNSYGILAAKKINDWQFNVGLYHIDNMEWFGEGKPSPHHTRVDASIIKHFNLSHKNRITVTLAAQNLGNSRYVEFHPDFQFDPRYYATVSFTRF